MLDRWLDRILDHPRRVFALVALVALVAGSLMVRVRIDTDPENMLSEDEPVRVFHREIKRRFALHDTIVIGIERPDHPKGVFTPESLGRIYTLSKRIEELDHVIVGDLLGPAHVDDIKEAGSGAVSFRWLLPKPPDSQAEADRIREAALRLPMLKGTVVSNDGLSLALYVPVEEKRYSYQLSNEIRTIIEELDGPESHWFAGLPVAEDTFGVEMFVQMAICAPLAGVAIFLLMWLFFRSVSLVASAMIVAMATVIITMGALIGSGFTVHIMSSMIAIFLMPIAVVDSVHILSEFADVYPTRQDAKAAVKEVVDRLFRPMLFTSLTSAAGFLSLLLTPIPPVRIFGAFVGLGIGVAFILTIVIIPAYIASMSPTALEKLLATTRERHATAKRSRLTSTLTAMRSAGLGASRLVLLMALGLVALGAYGITQIEINDNPVRWFRQSHEIRQADRKLNAALSGTYPAYLVIEPNDGGPDPVAAARKAIATADIDRKAEFEALLSTSGQDFVTALDDKILDDAEGEAAWSAALAAAEDASAERQVFKSPEWLEWLGRLQSAIEKQEHVGKTTSVTDLVKTVHRELKSGEPEAFAVPASSAGVAQTLLTFQSAHRPQDLYHLVTPSFDAAAVWFQLTSGDNRDMTRVRQQVDAWLANNPPPRGAEARWAGLTYINVVWQEKMVKGMLNSLLGAFVVVVIMMTALFRSPLYGALSMLPLAFTIVLVYGLCGLVGKDYDMPVAVLSSLSLGLSVDFAIHFIERYRLNVRENDDRIKSLALMFEEPARAILRNAIVIAVGFLPLLFAPLVPYNTVGVLMAAIMSVSCIVTLILLPAIFSVTTKERQPT